MHTLVEIVELTDRVDNAGIPHRGRNVEEVYSDISSDSDGKTLSESIQNTVADCYSPLRLPKEPTLY